MKNNEKVESFMRRLLSLSFVFVLCIIMQPHAFANLQKEVIVQYKSEEGKKIAIQHASEVIEEFKNLPFIVVRLEAEPYAKLASHSQIRLFEDNQSIQLNEQAQLMTGASLAEVQHWNLDAMNVHDAWVNGYTGKGVKVAVLDSGIASHPDLKIAGAISFIGDTYDDVHGHGTHVAGIIAAQHNGFGIAGIAPNVELYAVKVIENDGMGRALTVIKGIDWAIDNNIHIINLSFGGLEYSEVLYEAVKSAAESGVLIVAASGNEGTANGTGATINYPARHDEVIAVASVNRQLIRSPYSGTGIENDFAAPGEDIYSTFLNNQYATYEGTSLAAPHITGLLALLIEQYPELTAKELREGLHLMAEDLGSPGHDEWYGHGFPKYRSLEALALQNEQNKTERLLIEQIEPLLAEFIIKPTEGTYVQLNKLVGEMKSGDKKAFLQKKFDEALAQHLENATKEVDKFIYNQTAHTYSRASKALKNIQGIAGSEQLEERLEKALQQFATPAVAQLERFLKKPTKQNFKNAQAAINMVPVSTVKTDLLNKLNSKVQTLNQLAETNVSAYAKTSTLKNYNAALKAIDEVHDETRSAQLSKRVQVILNNQLEKAKIRVTNYEKKKTKSNRDLAMKIVQELPNNETKNTLLRRLK